MKLELNKEEVKMLQWLLWKGMEITNSNKKHEFFDKLYEKTVNNLKL